MIAWYRRRNRLGDLSAAVVCLTPALLVLVVFNVYPMLYSGYLSLLDWDGLSTRKTFIGLQNYIEVTRSGILGNSVRATFYYTAGVTVGGLALGLAAAVLVSAVSRGVGLYRAVYFLPVVTATVAAAVVWKLLLDPGAGYLNVILRGLGLDAPSWLRSTTWAMPAVMLVGVWKKLGFNMVVYLAGLQSIPREVYEAAQIDGAGSWAVFRHVTLPLLAPITLLLGILSVVDSFLVFDQVFVMTGGGPVGTTEVLGLALYRQAFRYFDLGGAAAIGWVMFALVAAVTLIQWRLYGSGVKGIG